MGKKIDEQQNEAWTHIHLHMFCSSSRTCVHNRLMLWPTHRSKLGGSVGSQITWDKLWHDTVSRFSGSRVKNRHRHRETSERHFQRAVMELVLSKWAAARRVEAENTFAWRPYLRTAVADGRATHRASTGRRQGQARTADWRLPSAGSEHGLMFGRASSMGCTIPCSLIFHSLIL